MLPRTDWVERVESLWASRNILWLAGVRRSGKTTLAKGLSGVVYHDCESPRVRRAMEDPEAFLEAHRGKRVVLDEIHRLDRPAELLKLAADHHPDTRILATGSSALGASAKFKDTLVGRKHTLWLTPMVWGDLRDFGQEDPGRRMERGGLPPFFLAPRIREADYQEWIDGFWAKDLQESFRLERREAFMKLTELVFRQSGGMFEAASFAAPCGISRVTVRNYLKALEETFLVQVLRPFHGGGSREIVAAPKVYGFDTGFVRHFQGRRELRPEDRGSLWEHLVLNEIRAAIQGKAVRYWRDKARHEVDFVLEHPDGPLAIEAKWKVDAFDPANLNSFRGLHPEGQNWVVASDVDPAFTRRMGAVKVRFLGLRDLAGALSGAGRE